MRVLHPYRKWAGSTLMLVFGMSIMAASIAGDHPADGVWALGFCVLAAIGFGVGGRSELVRATRGDGDERSLHIMSVTNSIVLNLAAFVGLVGAVFEQADGTHFGPWTLACVAGGAAYFAVFMIVRATV